MKISHCAIIALTLSIAITPVIEATGIHYHAKMLGKSIGRVAKAGVALHVLGAKKALLFGLPLAAGMCRLSFSHDLEVSCSVM